MKKIVKKFFLYNKCLCIDYYIGYPLNNSRGSKTNTDTK